MRRPVLEEFLTTQPGGVSGRVEEMLHAYRGEATEGDLMLGAPLESSGHWLAMLAGLAALADGNLVPLQDRVARQVQELGMAFRLAGEEDERSWPLNPVPLLIDGGEWHAIEQGMVQRAELLERVIGDIYGPQTLVARGALPAAVVTGSPHFWRQMVGVAPPLGHYLHFYAADLARGPDGEWRVLADFCRTPNGAGYALENRLALSRATGDLLARSHVRRLAPFFAAFRQGLTASCARSDPRIALLTPGRFNQSYAEQAHLARYLGFLLVEGDDLAVRDDILYVRTIEGMKRIDALWRRMDASLLDPLAFDARSRIGVPDLFDAISRGGLVVANWPGVGVVESAAFAAFLPRLAREVLGCDLALPNIATWWCGQPAERDIVLDGFDNMAIGAAFGQDAPGLDHGQPTIGATLAPAQRAALLDAMERRPIDYVGQELVQLSTTPTLIDGRLTARPFTLRLFVTRGADGGWHVMPGGFARVAGHGDIRAVLMGEGDLSADVCIIGAEVEGPGSLLDSASAPAIRRIAGTLPSKAADNLFWLGRYLERAETTLRVSRALLGGSLEADSGGALGEQTMEKLSWLLVAWGAAPRADADASILTLCRSAVGDPKQPASVHALITTAQRIGQGMRDRMAVDFWRLLSRPLHPMENQEAGPMLERLASLGERFSALSGLASENMVRSHGWRFHDLGRRLERAIIMCRLLRQFAPDDVTADDLTVLLDLADCQISYRTRYLSGLSLLPVRDMLLLEPENPRSVAFQIDLLGEHLEALPSLRDDGMPETPVRIARALTAALAAASAESMDGAGLQEVENRLFALSDAISRRFFLQERKAGRAMGMTRLA